MEHVKAKYFSSYIVLFSVLYLSIAFLFPAVAAENSFFEKASTSVFLDYQEPSFRGETSYGALLFNFLIALLITVGLIFLVKKIASRRTLESASRYIRIVDFFNLSYDRQIVLVEILGFYYVLGVTAREISLITEIKDKDTIDRLKFESDTRIRGSFFSDYLRNLMPRDERKGGMDDD